jgi:thiamine-phosphate pyrophosphorylase
VSARRARAGLPSRLLFVADRAQAPAGLPALVARAESAGVRLIEIRRKDPEGERAGTAERIEEARACLRAARRSLVLVNDRVDVALAAGAHGAHVGQDDLPAPEARRLLGPTRLLGLSTHDAAQFAAAQSLPLDYVALGPVFASATKSGHARPLGLDVLRECCAASRLPVVAIGGLDPARARAAIEAGAAAVAVASAVAVGPVERNVEDMLAAVGESPPEAPRHWALVGLPGSGKTTAGEALAALARRPFVDLDREVEREAGASVRAIFAAEGEAAFRAREVSVLDRILERSEPVVIALGGGALETEACRVALARRALVAWLQASPAACAARLADRVEDRPLLADSVGRGLEVSLAGLLARRQDLYRGADVRVDASPGPEEVAHRLLGALTPLGGKDEDRP